MTNTNPFLLLRLAWRHAWRRPLQSLFLVIGVAIGVAMIVAIDLANGSAQRAFELGAETVAGRATHLIIGGPNGLDESVYVALRRQVDYQLSAPIVEAYVTAPELDAQPMRLMGVDPFAEAPFRSYLRSGDNFSGAQAPFLRPLMVQPNTVLMSSDVARQYGVQVGDALTVELNGQSHRMEVVGLLEPSDDLSRRALEGLLIADIATAQEVLNSVGKLSRIDLIVPADAAGEAALARITSVLPPGAHVERSAARAGAVSEMTAAFRLNLTALSLLALVVGMFLIYNTVTFSVVQRRGALGSLRSLGMTRAEIFALILSEAGLLGLIGTALGLGLGIVLGFGAVRLVTQTVNDLFFVVAVREVDIPTFTLIKAAVIGILAALIGAAMPAYEATSSPPAGAMRRSNMEDRARALLPWLTVGGLGLLGVGALLLIPEWNLIAAFVGLFAVILGCALLTPTLTLRFMQGAAWLFGQLGQVTTAGIIERMAPRTVIRALSRTSVAVAALMVAVSVIIGVGVMIGSFRNTVQDWLADVLQADIFVTPPSLTSNQINSTLAPVLLEQLRNFPGIERVATSRGIDAAAYLAGETDPTIVRLVALSDDVAGPNRRYRSAVGDWAATWQALVAGGVTINEPMARRTGLGVGDELTLQTDRGRQAFSIVGVAVDFDVKSVVTMYDGIYRSWWDDAGVAAAALFVAPGVDVDAAVAQLRSALGGEAQLVIRSNRGMRQNALEIFDRTFAITVALQLLATIVAFIGILSTLMSLQLERMREIGVLRANGMTRGQLWRLSLWETGLMGSSAGLIAIPTGFLLALILIYIINLRSFGWTLEMQLQPRAFGQAFAVALGAALLAGIYPAYRLGRMQPAVAVREE